MFLFYFGKLFLLRMVCHILIKIADPVILQSDIEEFLRNNGESVSEMLDRKMTSELNKKISKSDVFKQLFQKGLSKPSVKNYMYLMTSSGAKGGVVSFRRLHPSFFLPVLCNMTFYISQEL